MKKSILTFALLCLACVSAMAGGIKVVNGDKKVFKNADGNVVLEFVFDKATFDDKMPLNQNEKFADLEHVKQVAMAGFKDNFNEKSKTAKVVDNASDAKYKITLNVTKIDQYVKVMGWVPAPATKTWGTLTVTNIATGEVLTTVDVKAVDGGANPSPDGCISDSFEELGTQVAGLR